MTQRSRNFLFTGPFSNGQRPDENDFNDVWESYINYQDDPISLDADNNYVFGNGIRIGDAAGDTLGTIRFVGGIFQFRESTGWQPLGAGGGGAFTEVGGGPHVAFNAGNVGIDTGAAATDYKFQVVLANNSNTIATVGNRVRIGNAAIFNQATGNANRRAYFSHHDCATDSNFALRQERLDSGGNGNVHLNTPTGGRIRFSHNGGTTRMEIASSGNVSITNDLDVGGTISGPTIDSLDSRITALGG